MQVRIRASTETYVYSMCVQFKNRLLFTNILQYYNIKYSLQSVPSWCNTMDLDQVTLLWCMNKLVQFECSKSRELVKIHLIAKLSVMSMLWRGCCLCLPVYAMRMLHAILKHTPTWNILTMPSPYWSCVLNANFWSIKICEKTIKVRPPSIC